jgi:hypothetical protein
VEWKCCPYRTSGYDARIEEKAAAFVVESSSKSPKELEVSFGRKYDPLRYAIPKISVEVTHAFMY